LIRASDITAPQARLRVSILCDFTNVYPDSKPLAGTFTHDRLFLLPIVNAGRV
jgi:hypothetical protein